ncbi:N-acetyltransferase family protein [Halobacteriales archaeon Cl-PHB]
MDIRLAKGEDTEEVIRVAAATWEHDYPDVLHRENAAEYVDEWYDEDRIRSEIRQEDAVVLVAEDEGDVVGFAHGVWDRRTGHILRLYVEPDYRERGIGRDLLAATRDALTRRGSDRIQATALADNDAGNEFYRSAGFEKIDEAETTIGGESYTEYTYGLNVSGTSP